MAEVKAREEDRSRRGLALLSPRAMRGGFRYRWAHGWVIITAFWRFWNFFLKKARKMNRNEGRHDLSHTQLLRASFTPRTPCLSRHWVATDMLPTQPTRWAECAFLHNIQLRTLDARSPAPPPRPPSAGTLCMQTSSRSVGAEITVPLTLPLLLLHHFLLQHRAEVAYNMKPKTNRDFL